MNTMSFNITGVPVPKARARVAWNEGRIYKFTPRRTRDWENDIRKQLWIRRPDRLIQGPVILLAQFRMPRPKRMKPTEWPSHIKRPDLDNLLKAVVDALIGTCIVDDSQIVKYGAVAKEYAAPGQEPGVYIELTYEGEVIYQREPKKLEAANF